MQQLRSFGLLVMPKVLVSFLTTSVMSTNILYDSEHASVPLTVFEHSFDVLESVASSYHEESLSSYAYKEMRVKADEHFDPSVAWPIDEMLRDLSAKSLSSPLFCRLMPQVSKQTRNISRECDAIWQGSRVRKEQQSDTPLCLAIPFVIIARINDKLDGSLSRK
jgi:hypothetical protein